ncbi:MAG: malate/lactate/ureidoglycolate dehydrogenase [Betaproteobacteria bacterium]|nr:malate/lactate/ureidoglycolate dehydrogenase [Betaproteobacteria bacterium]
MTNLSDVHVLPDGLTVLVRRMFERAGWDERDATLAAENLVLANLSGHDSHGVGLVPYYVQAAERGALRKGRTLTTVLDAGVLLTLDGGMGLGQVVGHDAMAIVIDRARSLGAVIMNLRNSHHLGRIGHWGEQAAAAGLVSLHFVNLIGMPALVAPWGGTQARFSTNPVCIAFPRPGEEPILLDFATARIAHGKTRIAWKRGQPVAEGNLLDPAGEPTTDPAVMWSQPLGALLPFGEHKGSGLAFMCELLAGALGGAGTIADRTDWNAVDNNMLCILIDPARMGGADVYAAEAERLLAWVHETPAARTVDRVRVPGEPEREARARRRAAGTPIDPTTWGDLVECAVSLGVSRKEIARMTGVSVEG